MVRGLLSIAEQNGDEIRFPSYRWAHTLRPEWLAPVNVPEKWQGYRYALLTAQPGDCVVITGKGDREEQIVGQRRLMHDDRAIARAWLYRQGGEELRRPKFRVVG